MKVALLFKKILATVVTSLTLATPALAQMLGRDINGHAVDANATDAVFLFDGQNTWLRDANAAAGSALDDFGDSTDGLMVFPSAKLWAESLVVGSFSGWSLPTASACDFYNCTSSQMGHLWYTVLGNTKDAQIVNKGSFQNLQGEYWTSMRDTEVFGEGFSYDFVQTFGVETGFQLSSQEGNGYRALAVRSGDVMAAVPEPETYAMLLAGLALVGAIARRRQTSQA